MNTRYIRTEDIKQYLKQYSTPRTLTFYDRQYRYEVKQFNKEFGNGRK
jgi:hypothetical protein